MKKWYFLLLWLFLGSGINATTREVKIKLVETSDIHGNFFPYNFIKQKPWNGSFARVCSYVREERKTYGDNLLLIDNGDVLQGQPSAYYYNYIDTTSEHVAASMLNYMGYTIGNMGNHDVETGHAVYDRWIRECQFPVLGANIIRTADESTYLKPYEVIERDGVKIVLLGMITPAIPIWLPENLWSGLRFDDMEQTARKWVPIIQEKEHPDLLIGVFHAGREARTIVGKYREDACLEIAKNVPGFDVVFMGHDHSLYSGQVLSSAGDSVCVVNPANEGKMVGAVEVTLTLENNKVVKKSVKGALQSMAEYEPDPDFMQHFASQYQAVEQFVSEKVGTIEETLTAQPAFFGPSPFVDLIHSIQLELTGADVSFSAPPAFNTQIQKGYMYMSDMFNLYKYENLLYTMSLTGREIKGYLEESYAIWTNQMKSADDHLLLLKQMENGKYRCANPYFNFDSAAGIIYMVDVTKPQGEKIQIQRMADGSPFDLDKTYKVAINSYRGNGGGDLLTKGAGIAADDLSSRILSSTEKDLRYYIMQYIKEKGSINPKPLNHWKMIPEEWTKKAAERDAKLIME